MIIGINSLRARHLENALLQYEKINFGNLPIDTFLRCYFRANKVSMNNRAWISDHMYEVLRWKGLIEHTSTKPLSWTNMMNTYLTNDRWRLMTNNKALDPHIRCSFPRELFSHIEQQYGANDAIKICNILNEEPMTYLRVNTMKITRDKIYKFLLHKGIGVEKCMESPYGLMVTDKKKLLETAEYKNGIVEIQDESSHIAALKVKPGQSVLDYCAGSGGKSLIFGQQMLNKGRIYLHDVNHNLIASVCSRGGAVIQTYCISSCPTGSSSGHFTEGSFRKDKTRSTAKRRLKRAGIRNYYVMDPNVADLSRFHGIMDWVVTDVPCTGVGAYRRNPDRKWSYTSDKLEKYVKLQRLIVQEALLYMKPNGKLVYITCSIFNEENLSQIDFLCKKHNLTLVETPTQQLPQSKGRNGFFTAILQHKH